LSLFLVSCSVWPPSLLEAAFFFCYSSTALAGGYSCVTLTLTLMVWFQAFSKLPLRCPPEAYIYSDVYFLILGENTNITD